MHLNTKLLHQGFSPEVTTGATAPPIFQSSSFAYGTAEELERVFAGQSAGFVYSRINNPSLDQFERRMAALEDGVAALSCSSGMAAISTVVLGLAATGDEIISGDSIFGGTYSLFSHTLARCGIKTRFVETNDVSAYIDAINDRTKLIFIETIGNPKINVPDIARISQVAKEHGIVLVVDNTATTPVLCRPKDLGGNIIVHSTSKYINGHGNAIGGIIIDSGNFEWDNPRYSHLRQCHERFGEFAFLANLRNRIHRDMGCCFTPFSAFLMSIGMESMGVRMERHCTNAVKVAEMLADNRKIEEVRYPGLSSHLDHGTAKRQFGGQYGALISMRLGSKGRCFNFINALQRILNLTNLGDAKTLVLHPASTFCRDATEAERCAMGVTDDLVRISIGIEYVDDICEDIEQALEKL